MNRYCNKFLSIILIFSFLSISIFSQNLSSSEIANREIAIRCGQVAKSFFMEESYEQAFSQAELGLAYDDRISDLWYVKAMCSKLQAKPKAEILEFSQKAFSLSDWTSFSEDLGTILYAESLISTGNSETAYEVLENRKDIYSRDAEYLRALSSYLLGDVTKARNIISSAIKVFPEDVRFAQLFYKSEYYNSIINDEVVDSGAISLASVLNPKISLWLKNCSEILFYAHFFETDEDLANRMLLQYFSECKLIPEAIPIAIKKSILSQENSRIAFESFCESGIDINLFKKILASFTEDKQKILAISFLSKFSGVVTYDINNDFIIDMKTFYSAGRPHMIQQDFDQNDIIDCEYLCDFGSPSILQNYSQNLKVTYGTYPFVDSVEIFDNTNYFLVKNNFQWTNIEFVLENLLMDFNFYIPFPILNTENIDTSKLFSNSYRISCDVIEENDVYQKRFVLSNGMPVQSTYSKNGIPYGNAIFEGGHILYRNVDKNYDGLYELTEYYRFDTFNHSSFIDDDERKSLYYELFGTIDALEGLYISKISIDDNNDGVPECDEEFLSNGKKTNWFDKDGNIVVSYQKEIVDDTIVENSLFVNPISNEVIKVKFENGRPKILMDSQGENKILQNETTPIYWINNIPQDELAILVFDSYSEQAEQGKVKILDFPEYEGIRIMSVKIGDYFFAESFEYEQEEF